MVDVLRATQPRVWTAAETAVLIRARRPWHALYDPAVRKLPVPSQRRAATAAETGAAVQEVCLIQQLLTPDVLLEVLSRLSPRYLARCSAVCRQWRTVTDSAQLWRAACLAVHAWRGEGVAGLAALERHCERFFLSSWRLMHLLRPRLRTDGLYVSRNTYLRRGVVELSTRVPVHIVVYYRYLAFSNGGFLYRTTPTKPAAQRVMARPRATLRLEGVFSGELRVSEAAVHTVVTYAQGTVSHLHTWLALRSTVPGANNRLDVRSMVQIEDGQPEPAEPDIGFDAYDDEQGRGWHAAQGGLDGWNEGLVRAHTRGLSRYIFVPWEELESSELNLDGEQMDYFCPG